jgi:hypothetical protein
MPKPLPAEQIECFPVGAVVENLRNDEPALVVPIAASPTLNSSRTCRAASISSSAQAANWSELKLVFPTGRNRPCQSVHASLGALERLGREQPCLDGAHDPAPRRRPERISVSGAAKPLQTAVPPWLDDHRVAPEAPLTVGGGVGASAIAANSVGDMNVRATVDAVQE